MRISNRLHTEIVRRLREYGKDALPVDTDLEKNGEDVVDESWFQNREGNKYKAQVFKKRDKSDSENFDPEYAGHPDIDDLKEHHMHLIAKDANDLKTFIKNAFSEYPELSKTKETVEKLIKYYTDR